VTSLNLLPLHHLQILLPSLHNQNTNTENQRGKESAIHCPAKRRLRSGTSQETSLLRAIGASTKHCNPISSRTSAHWNWRVLDANISIQLSDTIARYGRSHRRVQSPCFGVTGPRARALSAEPQTQVGDIHLLSRTSL
jgi:hypothetical protein